MTDANLIKSTAGAVTGFHHEVLLATGPDLPGRRIERVLGLVRGNTIRARHLGWDIAAVLRNIVGGEIREYTKLMAESREQALDRMIDQAKNLGANGIIGVRFTTSMVMGGAAELLAYGTAVVVTLEPEAARQDEDG